MSGEQAGALATWRAGHQMYRQYLMLVAQCREESDPRYITNAADVKLRSFSTKVGRSFFDWD